ncbi:MAG: putative 2-succinyl-6-hydroxy-2,4-cyclohexadiene-1-carboxylate synthase [Tepidiforma sp.]|nr:MAG: putative 2-succinyl-6-hydroxy-2,4-cyclohexadiene-1-carboxylate synthase [Tepidiforma sp.]
MTRVEVSPGFFLNVEQWGSGPDIVLLHGFTGSSRAWGEFGELLGRRLRCTAVDIAGHGASDAPSDVSRYHIERVAEDLVSAVGAVGVSRAPWLGYSMGGRTAIAVACLHPDAVSALVTIGASPGLETEEERAARRRADEALAERIEREGIEAFVTYWEALPLWASQARLPAEVLEAQRRVRLANRPAGLANSLRRMGTGAQPSFWPMLEKLSMPFLAIAGALDHRYAEVAERMAGLAPHGRFACIPGAGHAAQLEAPKTVADAVVSFLFGIAISLAEPVQ